jgi:peptide/nickel transport system permease protein
VTDAEATRSRSPWAEAWHRLHGNVLAMVCLAVISLYAAVAVLDVVPVPRFQRTDAGLDVDWRRSVVDCVFQATVGATNKQESYVAPGAGRHPLGTDIHGMDVLYKTLKSVKTAVVLGLLTALIYIPLGLLFGVIAGYFGGIVDDLIVYLYSTLACIPGILLLIGLMTVLEKGLVQLCIALGVTGWVGLCRLIRGETLKLRESDYVLAARAVGAGHARIILRHILPNLFHVVIIVFTLGFSGIVMSEIVLTYLGVGVGATTVSWGMMISSAKMELSRAPTVWWQLTSAAVALFILVLAFNVFGDALRDALDPRLRTGGGTE